MHTSSHSNRPAWQCGNVPVWESGKGLDLPSLEGPVEAEFCVVGLGGSGLAAITGLSRLGRSAVGIDAGRVAGGAAGRNGGFLLAGLADFYHDAIAKHGPGKARAIYQATCERITRMAQETPQAIRLVGSLRIAASEEETLDCQQHYQALRADGFPVEQYEGEEGHGLLIPTDGAFNPLLRCRVLARRALEAGVRLFEQAPALEISGDLVRTAKGQIHCQQVIVAVDGGLERLLPELEGRVRTARLQMLATAPTTEVSFPRPVYTRWGYDYWQQLPDGRVALGGYRDAEIEAEWTDSSEPSEAIQAHLEGHLRENLRVKAPITHRWAASVSYTATGLPIMEEVRPNVWAIGAYNGTGNVLGALCGAGLAQKLASGESELFDLLHS